MSATSSFDHICYRRNFLTEVIARIDFVSPLTEVASELPKEVSTGVLRHFPIAEPKPVLEHEFDLSTGQLSKKAGFTQWNFYGKAREKRAVISPKFAFVSYGQYRTYDDLREEFLAILNPLFSTCRDAQPSRIGLRYINTLPAASPDPFKWDGYIDRSLLGLLSFTVSEAERVRVFHNYECAFPDFNLRFQFGMPNPDYPAPIRQPVFILDFDAYRKGLFDTAEAGDHLGRFHQKIQSLFERVITAKLREVLDEGE
jgi:uncharacterized protein (TIGR04255 family)